jgi:hypothetical protein
VPRGQHDGSLLPNSRNSRLEPLLFLFKYLLSCTHEAEWTPFQTHYFSENLVAPGIEPDLWIYSQELWSLDHTGGLVEVEVEFEVNLRPTVSRPIRPGVRHPSGTRDQFFPFTLWLFFRQFRVCWCGAPSLTRSRVCTFSFCGASIAQRFSNLSPTGLMSVV